MAQKKSRSKTHKVTKWVRADTPCEHPGLTFKEALDIQHDLIKREGSQDPEFIYTIEESG